MYLNWPTNIMSLYFILFNVFICFIQLNDSATIADLEIICAIKYEPNNQLNNGNIMNLNNVNEYCTSLLFIDIDYPGNDPFSCIQMESLPDIPIILVVKSITFFDWQSLFSQNIDVTKYVDIINKNKLGGIFFGNIYSKNLLIDNKYVDVLNTYLPTFLNAIRENLISQSNDVLLGLTVSSNPKIIVELSEILSNNLDNFIDAYLVNATIYKQCTVNGGSLSSPQLIKNTAEIISQSTFIPSNKVIMAISLFAVDPTCNNKIISYEEACSLCPGTKVCIDTLYNIYLKAAVIKYYELNGICVVYMNTDDVQGSCFCGDQTTYPGMTAIAAGFKIQPLPFLHCPSFGVPGVYNPNYQCVNVGDLTLQNGNTLLSDTSSSPSLDIKSPPSSSSNPSSDTPSTSPTSFTLNLTP